MVGFIILVAHQGIGGGGYATSAHLEITCRPASRGCRTGYRKSGDGGDSEGESCELGDFEHVVKDRWGGTDGQKEDLGCVYKR